MWKETFRPRIVNLREVTHNIPKDLDGGHPPCSSKLGENSYGLGMLFGLS